ncbi:MAG: hypothetical protein A3I78_08900 [Gammaproteobacteria bacterium RIFCSPLOWO2_02_FULL_56_15]|nr:MAG: hypothetical protein A3I78_08900 [Gammaproteobacteria bacterium RIFCSPLOWO2_02_FULL_56_15]
MKMNADPLPRNNPGRTTAYPAAVTCLYGLLISLVLGAPIWRHAHAETDDTERKSAELESVRSEIRAVQDNLSSARTEMQDLTRELQENEKSVALISTDLHRLEDQIATGRVRLEQMEKEKAGNTGLLDSEREYLRRQIQAAYRMGRNDYIKLLLNMEDPDRTGRMLAYFDYYNRSRSHRIGKISKALAELKRLEDAIRESTDELAVLRSRQLLQLEELTEARHARNNALSRLEAHVNDEGKRLLVLQQDAEELETLIGRLQEPDSVVELFEEIPPFDTMRGKLKWPVQGPLTERFGDPKKGDKLRHEGVTISAESGAEVLAVSPGKVVFADWFRNLGLLLILDHGEGYMSLYGHNGRLLKKVGDWVSASELISIVGDTGGQTKAGLYFEIRRAGNPVDPGLWCRG